MLINKHIFLKTIRANWVMFLVTTAIPLLVGVAIVSLGGNASVDNDPNQRGITINTVLNQAYFGFSSMTLIVSLIYLVVTGNKLVANEVQTGKLVYVVASPITRTKIITTKIFYFLLTNLLFFVINAIVFIAILKGEAIVGLSIGKLIIKLLAFTLLIFASGSIIFLLSTIFNKSWLCLSIGGGILLIFFLFSILGSIGVESLKFLKYLSLNSLFDAESFDKEGSSTVHFNAGNIVSMVVLALVGIGCYLASYVVFIKKDLPL